MAYPSPPDLEKLVREQTTARGYASVDDLLRDALDAPGQFAGSREDAADEYRQTVAAVRAGIADMEAGRMRPLRAILAEVRGQKSPETE